MGRLEPVHLEGEAGDRACTASNLLAHFRRGEVVTMRSDRLLPPEVRRLDLHTLSAEVARVETGALPAAVASAVAAPVEPESSEPIGKRSATISRLFVCRRREFMRRRRSLCRCRILAPILGRAEVLARSYVQ